MTFGEKLKELRKAAGKSRVDLAVAAGVSAGFVRDLEQGHRANPSWNTVVAIVAALGTDCTAFAGCDEPSQSPPAPPPPPAPKRRRKA